MTESSRPLPPPTRIALTDDHAVVRQGYRRLLEMEPSLRIVAEYGGADETAAALLGPRPAGVDVLLLDLSMPGRPGLDLLRELNERRPALAVIVVTMHDAPALMTQSRRAGAAGFVSKSDDPQVLIDTVLAVAGGRHAEPVRAASPVARREAPHQQLTARESEILGLLLAGSGIDEIAQRLQISEKTVWNNQTLIRQKLGVSNALEMLQYARRHGLLP